ncbi:MAG: nitrogen fixation negative regulator NifL [Methylococcaceae bacterium]|nr:MAG: nitrogen fixation negative regulator NifL [Methylococcaceae bacterium]
MTDRTMTVPPASPEQQAVLRDLFEETVAQAPVAISITDSQANILYVNQNFAEVTGYAPEECIGRNESMLSDQRTPKAVYQALWQTIQARQTWQGTLVNRHKSGRRYLAHVSISPILDAQGHTSHYIGMHRDVTDVYTLEQQVKNQKVLIESVVDLMPMATVLIDEQDKVVLDNQMYKTLISDLGQQEPSQLFLPVLREALGEEWPRLQSKGHGFQEALVIPLRGGFRNREVRIDRGGYLAPRWYACSGSWFSHSDGQVDNFFQGARHTYLLLTLNDITQQKRQEEAQRINAMRALLAEEEKCQSVREALLGAIHHIEAPLNLLTAAKNLAVRRDPEQQNSAFVELLQQILDAGAASVAHLKACIPPSCGASATSVNINQLIHETIVLLTERLLASGVVVDWRPTPVLPSLMGAEQRLRSVFKHLIENAVEAMNHSGIRRRELRIVTWSDNELVHIAIEDSGPGIADNLRVKVFEPFFSTRTDGGHGHTGMGLTMAQDVINQHQGLIRIDPTYRDGCRVLIQLPIHQEFNDRG